MAERGFVLLPRRWSSNAPSSGLHASDSPETPSDSKRPLGDFHYIAFAILIAASLINVAIETSYSLETDRTAPRS
jgi:hypothetical protein